MIKKPYLLAIPRFGSVPVASSAHLRRVHARALSLGSGNGVQPAWVFGGNAFTKLGVKLFEFDDVLVEMKPTQKICIRNCAIQNCFIISYRIFILLCAVLLLHSTDHSLFTK